MRRRSSVLVGIAALVMGVSLVAAPSISQAVVISSVSVDVGGTIYSGCITAAVCTNKIWDLGASGITLSSGQTLVLTQTSGFNFDTDDAGNLGPTPFVVINHGAPVLDTTKNVTNGGFDPETTNGNEAKNYSAPVVGLAGVFTVAFGYADNLHTDVCNDTVGTVASNCFPDNPFSDATHFLGAGTNAPAGFPAQTNSLHCAPANGTCYDAGVVLIRDIERSVPEPSTLFLLGAGLIGLATYGRKLLGKNT